MAATPNSIYEQMNPDGTVYSYNENGQPTEKSDEPLPEGYSNKPTN